jgi:hypothetical protein
MGELKYNEMMQGEVVSRKVLKPEKKIFRLYKSFTHKETEKIKKTSVLKVMVAMLVLFPLIGFIFYKRLMPSQEEIEDNRKKMQIAQKGKVIQKEYNKKGIVVDLSKPFDHITGHPLKIVKIESFAYMKGKLFFIIDPVTGMRYEPDLYENKIVRKGNSFYTYINEQDYEKYIKRILRKSTQETEEQTYNEIDQI